MNQLPDFTEEKTSSRVVYDGAIIRVEKDSVRLPDGNSAKREIVRHPGAAVIAPMPDDKTVLLERQFRYALGRHTWEFPAGKLEKDEPSLEAAKRELLEETGYKAAKWERMISVYSAVGFCDERLDIFLARELSYVGHVGEPDEFIYVQPTSIADALQMIDDGEIDEAKTIIGLWWLRCRLAR